MNSTAPARRPSYGLYALLIDAGGQEVIPEALCAAHQIGRDRVWAVLVHRCLMANETTGQIFWSAAELARQLGLHESRVRYADKVLQAAGLMVKVGKKGRANLYVMVPVLIAQDHETPVDNPAECAGDTAGECAGDTAGNPAGIPALSGKGKGKMKGRGVSRVQTHDMPSGFREAQPLPCPTHGTANSTIPCRHCADFRRWVKGQPSWAPPSVEQLTDALDNPCRHGTPAAGGNPQLCPACRRMPKLVKA